MVNLGEKLSYLRKLDVNLRMSVDHEHDSKIWWHMHGLHVPALDQQVDKIWLVLVVFRVMEILT